MRIPIPKKFKSKMKLWIRTARSAYVNRFRQFTPEELGRLLHEIGIRPGDVVMVHSAFGRFEGFTGNVMDVISVLQTAVGEDGVLLMPTMPSSGSAVDWALQNRIMDVRKTPSHMGVISELFRRSQGVLRSVHPTHPVAAWGRRANELIAGHHLADSPCGPGSPFFRLLECDGKILHLGSEFRTTTFVHAIDNMLAADMPFDPFTKDYYILKVRDLDGAIVESRLRLFEKQFAALRNLEKLVPLLRERGYYHERTIGSLPIILVSAAHLLEIARGLSKRGVYFYDVDRLEPQRSSAAPQE